MNHYTTTFFGRCPTNGVRISYALQISTQAVIPVEQILMALDNTDHKFHEQIADMLIAKFGGEQTLTADHHGVSITTERTA